MGDVAERPSGAPERLIAAGAAMLAGSVLTDSGMEHYRGSFRNPAMVLPLGASATGLTLNSSGVGSRTVRATSHVASLAIGTIGLGFHLHNIRKRPGGFSFTNAFYGAPAGAPGALILSGLIGALGDTLATPEQRLGPVPVGSGRVIGAAAAAGLLGTVAEAGFLHFRGAYHDPFMWVPVTLPPITAAVLARDVVRGAPSGLAKGLLVTTAAMGFIGVGFHAWGIQRNMGGWRNWRQNILAGPPLPAPPSFTGLALVGVAALLLMGRRNG